MTKEAWSGLPTRASCATGLDAGRPPPIVFDERGNGWHQLGGEAWGLYPASELEDVGRVAGREIPCISALLELQHHQGYEWRELDRHDLALLAAPLGLSLPRAARDVPHMMPGTAG